MRSMGFERIAFSTAQMERVFSAARVLGLPVQLHAEQLSDSGGTQLAARYCALSCDHLEWLSPEGAQAMAAAGSVAVLLPGAFYFLRETKLPPIALLRQHGVPMAVSTDSNPGTSPCTSLLLMLNMSCTLFRLTPEEALAGVTRHAATALGLQDRGAGSWQAGRLCVVGRAAPCRTELCAGQQPTATNHFQRTGAMNAHTRFTPCSKVRCHCWSACRTSAPTSPPSCKRSTHPALQVEDTDWHLHTLYNFLADMGASVLTTTSRYVIDLNRPPDDAPMYPGAANTELCPTHFFTGEPLYQPGQAPAPEERLRRRETYWQPYHSTLEGELARLKALHGLPYCGMRTAFAQNCRGCLKAACPT